MKKSPFGKLKTGALHKTLGVSKGEKIPIDKLMGALQSKSPLTRRRAQFAQNAKSFKHKSTKRKLAAIPMMSKAMVSPNNTSKNFANQNANPKFTMLQNARPKYKKTVKKFSKKRKATYKQSVSMAMKHAVKGMKKKLSAIPMIKAPLKGLTSKGNIKAPSKNISAPKPYTSPVKVQIKLPTKKMKGAKKKLSLGL